MAADRWEQRSRSFGVGAVLVALCVVAVAGCGGGSSQTRASVISTPGSAAAPAAAPAPVAAPAARPSILSAQQELAANTRQANQILGSAIAAKLAALKGVPVVVNQWASWCPNCRAEFPFFQQVGRQDAGRVAFVGLDSQDSQSAAAAFLRSFPVDYPSVFDPSASQAQSLGGGQAWPTTFFVNAAHKLTNLHVGGYQTLQSLEQDIARYT